MPNRKTQPLLIYTLFAFIYVLSAVYAMSFFFQNSNLGDLYPRTRFDAMVDGSASKPFVYRQLVPFMVRSVDRITPPMLRSAASTWLEEVRTSDNYGWLRHYTPWINKTFPVQSSHYRRLVASVIIFASLLGYFAFLFLLARELFPAQPAVALFAPPLAIVAFSSFGYQWQYIYDIPCLMLSAACFYFLYKEKLRLYLLFFLLACLNKETAIFNLAFFVVWAADRMENRKFLLLWMAQAAIYLIVKVGVSIEYMSNPGVFLEQNMGIVMTRDVLAEANIHKLVAFAVLWFLFTYRWQDKPLFLKRSLWIIPCIYLAYFLYGFPHEYRVFFDLHAPLILLATHTLVVGTGIAASPSLSAANLRWRTAS